MHRMRLLAKPTSLLAVSAALVGVGVPAISHARGSVVVSSVTEPPDVRPTRGHWRTTVTVSNQGATTAGAVRLRMFLSRGRRFSRDDLPRELKLTPPLVRSYSRMSSMRVWSRRITATIPASIPERSYYVVTCLSTARVASDNLRCHFSGQMMTVGTEAPTATGTGTGTGNGATGPAGPSGPAGPAGPAGPKGDTGPPGCSQVCEG
jgi:hypothetical protein